VRRPPLAQRQVVTLAFEGLPRKTWLTPGPYPIRCRCPPLTPRTNSRAPWETLMTKDVYWDELGNPWRAVHPETERVIPRLQNAAAQTIGHHHNRCRCGTAVRLRGCSRWYLLGMARLGF
jgi:hypothetical protein